VLDLVSHPQLDRGLRDDLPVGVLLHGHVVLDQVERGAVGPYDLLDEQIEGRVRGLELKALVLQFLDPGEDFLGQLPVLRKLDLLQLGQDVGSAAQLGDQVPPLIAYQGRVDMFVGPAGLAQGVDVEARLVGERALAHVRHVEHGGLIADLGDEPRDLRERLDLLRGQDLQPHLQGQIRDHRAEIGVAAPLAQAVDRALDLAGAGPNRGQAVGHSALRVVVGVDGDGQGPPLPAHGLGDVEDLLGQAAPVRIAEDQGVRPRMGGRVQDTRRRSAPRHK